MYGSTHSAQVSTNQSSYSPSNVVPELRQFRLGHLEQRLQRQAALGVPEPVNDREQVIYRPFVAGGHAHGVHAPTSGWPGASVSRPAGCTWSG